MKLTENIMLTDNNSSKNDETKNELNELYNSLFNSLGVEPGLLSKTPIGRNLNSKFRNDSLDAEVYAANYIQEKQHENIETTVMLDKYTPIGNSNTLPEDTIIGCAPIEKDSLWQLMRKAQLRNKLSTDMVISEISEYLKRYAPDYTIDIISKIKENLNDK